MYTGVSMDSKQYSVLLVEDDPDIQLITRLVLEKKGKFHVRGSANGLEALHALQEFRPDLILLDVMMPGMDGIAMLRALRASTDDCAQIPVVFMTAKVQPAEVALYYSLGAIDVIAKPFEPMLLVERLKRILA
jgi:two-component system OmpR family response regulator